LEIPFLNLATARKKETFEGILSEIGRIAQSSDFILGAKVAELEARFSAREGASYGVACNSGLDALILSLKALGVGPGDEVITSPFSFIATAAAISLVGATPVFADIGEDGILDPRRVETRLTARTKAVLPVLWAGIPGRLAELKELCQDRKLALVLDAAQAVGSTYEGKGMGAWGDAVCYSLHPLKNLGVWGDGGILLTDDETLAGKLKLARNHGLVDRDTAEFFSYNSRLDTIQAVVALAYLELLDEVLAARSRHAEQYLRGLSKFSCLHLPLARTDKEAAVGVHLLQLVAPRRDALRASLAAAGIETKVHYPILLPFQPAAKSLGYRKGDFPVAEWFSSGVLSLPIREDLEAAEIERVIDGIRAFYQPALTPDKVPDLSPAPFEEGR
jgi:dTDP-3-amino-2,3,6-trideoxy-4-keto-D-glucose/dTDP-3-amino-3,4,6-trideoxy-alpha-D-glucose/dTDP-2,6-dideoxy-D-kanosamine transaminase